MKDPVVQNSAEQLLKRSVILQSQAGAGRRYLILTVVREEDRTTLIVRPQDREKPTRLRAGREAAAHTLHLPPPIAIAGADRVEAAAAVRVFLLRAGRHRAEVILPPAAAADRQEVSLPPAPAVAAAEARPAHVLPEAPPAAVAPAGAETSRLGLHRNCDISLPGTAPRQC